MVACRPRALAPCAPAARLQELVKGVTLNKIGNDKDPQQMARGRHALDQVIDAMGLMVFKDGFFHADPHPVCPNHCTPPPELS